MSTTFKVVKEEGLDIKEVHFEAGELVELEPDEAAALLEKGDIAEAANADLDEAEGETSTDSGESATENEGVV